jgi:crotonobetainyl-CoA:carnitine CoA-transferase CaiB-like acyl-CoA transferase
LVKNIVCDKVTAVTASQAITAALLARERGAGGQEVKLSMMDAGISFMWPDGCWNNTLIGEDIHKMPQILSYLKPTKTVDGYVTCAALSDEEWHAVCDGIGRPELATDPKFLTLPDRLKNWDGMTDALSDACAALTTEEICARMEEADAPYAKVTAIEQLHEDPQIQHQKSLTETTHPQGGLLRMPSPASRFQNTPSEIRHHSPMLGEHTDDVLLELGLFEDQIEVLREAGIVE